MTGEAMATACAVIIPLKYCFRCKNAKPHSEFGKTKHRYDGLTTYCLKCEAEYHRLRQRTGRRPGNPGRPPKDGDIKQAQRTIWTMIERGELKKADCYPCADCGHHNDFRKPRRHEWDHYLGYAAAHHKDVEAVCVCCHKARENGRTKEAAF